VIRQPVDLKPKALSYLDHIELAIKNDGKLCRYVAKESYVSELGARSLTTSIDDIRRNFFHNFVDSDELVTEVMN
jgi:hypothetical protein